MRTSTTQRRIPAPLILGLLLLPAACAGAETDDADAAPTDAAAAEDATGEPVSDDDGEADEAPAAPTSTGPLTAEDGWNGAGDVGDLAAGTGVLQVAGEEIALEVTCTAPGPLEDHHTFLFAFDARGDGVDSQGRDVYVEVKRRITLEPESFYDYDGYETGTVQTVVALGGEPAQFHSAIIVSPADDDSAGEKLPVVQVDEDGAFTVDEDVPAMMMHDEALAGPTDVAGRCQDAWPGDATGDIPMF